MRRSYPSQRVRRLKHPFHRSTQSFACHCADIAIVRRTQIIDEQRLDARRLIPFWQCRQIIPNGMIGTIIRHLADGDIIIAVAERTVARFDVADDLLVVRVPPEFRRVLPRYRRNIVPDLHAVRKLVEHDALQLGIVLDDEQQIGQSIFEIAHFVVYQF